MRLTQQLFKFSKLAVFLLASSFLNYTTLSAQGNGVSLNCEQSLDEAKNLYKEGKLQLVKAQFSPECIYGKRLSRENKVQAFRLFTETSLFTNEIDDATQYFEILLRHDPLFEVDSTDSWASYDLIYMSRTYKRNPVISWYASLGMNYSHIETLQKYSTMNNMTTTRDLSKFTIGWNASTGIEVPVYKNFDIVLEANFSNRTYHKSTNLHVVGSVNHAYGDTRPYLYSFGSTEFKESQLAIDIPVLVRYNYHWKKRIIPYGYVGVAPSMLINAKLKGLIRRNVGEGLGGSQVAGTTENTIFVTKHIENDANGNEDKYRSTYQSLRNTYNIAVIAGVGCKFRVRENFVFFDIRYNRFLNNSVNTKNRYTHQELLNRYAHVDDDFRIDNVAISFGFIKSFYTPRRKSEYNTRTAARNFDKEIESYKAAGITNPNVMDAETRQKLIDETEKNKQNYLDDIKAGRATTKDASKYINSSN